jgi:hypothetical protein
MPPTIMVTVGRLLFEFEPLPLVDALLPPDEQAARVSVVAHAAASAVSELFLKPALGMVLLLVSLRGMAGVARDGRKGTGGEDCRA